VASYQAGLFCRS